MRLVSWNVNGLRAVLKKDFAAQFAALDADVFCVQETKMQPGQAEFTVHFQRRAQGLFRRGGVDPCAAAQRAAGYRPAGI